MLAPRQQQRVYHALPAHCGAASALQFGIKKAEIEHCVMRDELGVAEEGDQVIGLFGKQRLVLEELDRQSVNLEGRLRHVAFRVEVEMERLAGRETVDELDAANLNQPIARKGIKAGCFGIENDFAHRNSRTSLARRIRLSSRHISNGAQNVAHLGAGVVEALQSYPR